MSEDQRDKYVPPLIINFNTVIFSIDFSTYKYETIGSLLVL